MKIYLAGRYSRRGQLRDVAEQLRLAGHTITSRWLDTNWDQHDDVGSAHAPPEYREEYAQKDMEDVRNCDCLIAFTEEPRTGGRGGRHVEFGLAVAWGKALAIVGPRENVFHHLPAVQVFNNHWDLVRAFSREEQHDLAQT